MKKICLKAWCAVLLAFLVAPCASTFAAPLSALTIADTTVIEGSDTTSNASFVISLSKPAEQIVIAHWKTANGAAKAPSDYQAASGQAEFKTGETSHIISVPVISDLMDEENEVFYVLLTSATGAAIGRGRAIATVQDDDSVPTISLENTLIPEGNPFQDEGGQSAALLRLRLSAPSGKIVRVNCDTQSETGSGVATANKDYLPLVATPIVFNSGQNSAVARVLVLPDLRDEVDEKVTLKLSQPINATLAAPSATLTLLNDDSAPALRVGDVVVNETATAARFEVGLSMPSAKAITVNWKTTDGTAISPLDYEAQNGTLAFAPGETNRSFEVPINADALNEGTENFYILLSGSVNASIGRGRGMGTLLNGDKIICPPLTKIRFFPRRGYASRLFRGQFYGSNAGPNSQLQFITSVSTMPLEGQWNEIVLPKAARYRFLKFEAPNNSFGGLAELEFWSDNARISGTPLGSASAPTSPNTFNKAFDNNADTFFEGVTANNQWLALDLGADKQAQPPIFLPPPGIYPQPIMITIASRTPDAKIRITRSGATILRNLEGDPTRENGEAIMAPFLLDKSTVFSAIAYTDDLAASATSIGAYKLPDNFVGLRTFHIGNSLTFGMDRWLQPLSQSAGKSLDYHRFTFSGAAIDYLWQHPGSGFGDTHYPEALQVLAPFNHIFTQPFAGRDKPIENEAEYSQKFYNLARQNSPDVQAWLYAQWPDKSMAEKRTQGLGSALPLNLPKPTTWQEGVDNNLKFIEAVREKINQTYTGKPVLIVPAGPALAALKTEIDAGRVPGLTDFWKEISADGLHLQGRGNYMVALVFYACLFKESPEGKVSALDSGLTPEQAAIFQRIAWQTARNYAFSGLAR